MNPFLHKEPFCNIHCTGYMGQDPYNLREYHIGPAKNYSIIQYNRNHPYVSTFENLGIVQLFL